MIFKCILEKVVKTFLNCRDLVNREFLFACLAFLFLSVNHGHLFLREAYHFLMGEIILKHAT